MQPVARLFILLGSVNAALAVILGAFGAHILKARLSPEMLNVYQVGSHYHFYHAIGMLVVGLLAAQLHNDAAVQLSGFLMLAGIVLFSVHCGMERSRGCGTPRKAIDRRLAGRTAA